MPSAHLLWTQANLSIALESMKAVHGSASTSVTT